MAAPAVMVKIPVGLRTRPTWWQLDCLGGWQPAWQSAAALWAARPGVHGHACHEEAHGDDLLPLPNLASEGTGSPAEDGVGAIVERVERGDHTAAPDPDEARTEEISRELSWHLAT